MLLELVGDVGDGLLDALLQLDRVDAGHDRPEPFVEDGLGHDGGGGGAVAGDVAGLAGDFADHPGAHVLVDVLQVDLLGHGHAVLGDRRRAEALLQDHVAAAGPERHFDRLGQLGNAAPHGVAGFLVKRNHLGHEMSSPCMFGFEAGLAPWVRGLGSAVEVWSESPILKSRLVRFVYSMTARMSSSRISSSSRSPSLNVVAGVGAEQHAVADLHLQRAPRAVVQQPAVADADDLAAGGLVLGRVGQDDAAGGDRFRLLALDDHAVAQRLELDFARVRRIFLFCHA